MSVYNQKIFFQSSLIKSLTFQSSKLPSGKYLLIINGILFSISSFSAIEIGSVSSFIYRKKPLSILIIIGAFLDI